jgi:Family of unknown function (DUF6283)
LTGPRRHEGCGFAVIIPRRLPCASCPYRRDAPSGLWAADEYDKLPRYDGTIAEQAMAGAVGLFFCHTQDGHLCAGWVGCHDMGENLAVRLTQEPVDYDAVVGYESPVPLFASGAEAAEHGKRDIPAPGPAARRKAAQLIQQRDRRGRGVTPP